MRLKTFKICSSQGPQPHAAGRGPHGPGRARAAPPPHRPGRGFRARLRGNTPGKSPARPGHSPAAPREALAEAKAGVNFSLNFTAAARPHAGGAPAPQALAAILSLAPELAEQNKPLRKR